MGATSMMPARHRRAMRASSAPISRSWPVAAVAFLVSLGASLAASAQETVCARVKIEIKQELTFERQAFDAEMKIHNTTDTSVIESVGVTVKVTDENGTPVPVTDNANDLSAKFFIRIASRENIGAVDGTGTVNAKTTAAINWLIIPTPGAGGTSALGKKYLVGATLRYRFGGEETTLDVSPDVITVKPLPLLTLDYFLTRDVNADDPMTPAIEPVEPFTLGVRVKNNGAATAKALKIDSAQPKIIENNQGLLINFQLTGSYVNDAPVQNSLLIDFGDIAPTTAKMGRWQMETTLAGTFTEFSARFTHSDELGGALTSLLQATNAHLLIHDVRVDLPGRDFVRDFLAYDGDVIRIYESDSTDTEVTNRSAQATLTETTGEGGTGVYRFAFPPTAGFSYARLPDPFAGQKTLGKITRSDAKVMAPENVWLSKTRNSEQNRWDYWVHIFDVNSSGVYTTEFNDLSSAPRPPAIQFVPDRTVREGQQVSFVVEASSPDGRPLVLSAAPLPTGATFTQQPTDPLTPNLKTAVFDWTPTRGQAGNYFIAYTAQDGLLGANRSASIRVESAEPPPGPTAPTIESPGVDVHVAQTQPTLTVRTSTNSLDPTTQVQFEIYGDEAMTQLIDSALIAKGTTTGAEGTTSHTVAADLNDNTRYWWRARAFDGVDRYSPWVNGRFFVNLFNDAPESFNLAMPAPGAEVTSAVPELSWTNSEDADGDGISYTVQVYSDTALTQLVASASGLANGEGGTTAWVVNNALTNHATYYWRAIAIDSNGAETPTIARPFTVNTGNTAPSDPAIVSPLDAANVTATPLLLTIQSSVDAEHDLITYVFEIDTVPTFDSGDKRTSGQIVQGSAATVSWSVDTLVENQRYWWRAKAQDGRTESAWVAGSFLMNAANDLPPAPTVRNPGDGAWSTTTTPTFEANPVEDPEGQPVHYEFEVYLGAQSGGLVVSGASSTNTWPTSVALADDTTHRWRVRAVDELGAASEWSAYAVLYVSTGPYEDPSIQVTTPSVPAAPDTDGTRKTVTINWQGTDNNIEANVALYYSTSRSEFVGDLIVEGLRQPAGTHAGSYVWDVTGLAPGAYYVYGVIYDSRGIGRGFAPGAVVVPNASQSGGITVTAAPPFVTTEAGGTYKFNVRLASAPTEAVTVQLRSTRPSEGVPQPATLTFTPQNWSVDQQIIVTGVRDCAPDGVQSYDIQIGRSVSLDPNYIGISAPPVQLRNFGADVSNTTNVPALHVCRITAASKTRVGLLRWEYTLTAELTNTGTALTSVAAVLASVPGSVQIVEGQLQFGAVGASETVKSTDTITIRTSLPFEQLVPLLGLGFRWTVTTTE